MVIPHEAGHLIRSREEQTLTQWTKVRNCNFLRSGEGKWLQEDDSFSEKRPFVVRHGAGRMEILCVRQLSLSYGRTVMVHY